MTNVGLVVDVYAPWWFPRLHSLLSYLAVVHHPQSTEQDDAIQARRRGDAPACDTQHRGWQGRHRDVLVFFSGDLKHNLLLVTGYFMLQFRMYSKFHGKPIASR